MSGGVDSSVAAALLLRQGYEVVGCFMRLGSVGEAIDAPVPVDEVAVHPETGPPAGRGAGARSVRIHHQGCCSVSDAADARMVAAMLGIPLYVVNFRRDFGRVIDHFVAEYDAGRTPNPCVRCNDWLKFGRLFDHAEQLGADFVASGHYARTEPGSDGPSLRRGVDGAKDQSYVLFGLRRSRLGRTLLPVGGYCKPDIRAMARDLGLPVFEKPDSQEICFVPDNDYAALVARRGTEGVGPGPVLHEDGRVLGEHPGHQHFTIGQRRGLGIASSRPLYVIEKDPRRNTIVVGERASLGALECEAGEVNWLASEEPPGEWFACGAQIRAHGEATPAQARCIEGRLQVRFEEPVMAAAPGQAIVLYEGDRVLGGGWIERSGRGR